MSCTSRKLKEVKVEKKNKKKEFSAPKLLQRTKASLRIFMFKVLLDMSTFSSQKSFLSQIQHHDSSNIAVWAKQVNLLGINGDIFGTTQFFFYLENTNDEATMKNLQWVKNLDTSLHTYFRKKLQIFRGTIFGKYSVVVPKFLSLHSFISVITNHFGKMVFPTIFERLKWDFDYR